MNHTVRKCAQPISLIHEPQSHYAVIGFHGFSGYPGELALIAKLLYESGYDVYVPRYPGHGTDGEDFSNTNSQMWVEEALRSYELINGKYKSISVIGHSMGGGVALAGVGEGVETDGLILAAPAVWGGDHLALPYRAAAWSGALAPHFVRARGASGSSRRGSAGPRASGTGPRIRSRRSRSRCAARARLAVQQLQCNSAGMVGIVRALRGL